MHDMTPSLGTDLISFAGSPPYGPRTAPDGAFYLFPRLASGDDLASAEALLEAA